MKTKEEKEKEVFDLEIRKVKALEKIGNSLDALTVWFEEIDKDDWSARIQWYLAELKKFMELMAPTPIEEVVEEPIKKVTKK